MATASGPQADHGAPLTREFGPILMVVHPCRDGSLARFLLFRRADGGRSVLLASGSEETLSGCLERAERAACAAAALTG